MMQVIRKNIVSSAFASLRSKKVHPLFAGYLHLRSLAQEQNSRSVRPDFTGFYKRFFAVADGPETAPFLRPFVNHKATADNLWMNRNVAGSYAKSSLREGQPFSKVVETTADGTYRLKNGHGKLAARHLLYGRPLPATELAAFLYRDFGLAETMRQPLDLLPLFAKYFGFSSSEGALSSDFFELFESLDTHPQQANWFETIPLDVTAPDSLKQGELATANPIRKLSATEVLESPNDYSPNGPPLMRLRVSGLLSFAHDTEFELGRLNILVGANGSGKSNFIDCIRLLKSSQLNIQEPFSSDGFEAWLYNGSDKSSATATLVAHLNLAGVSQPIIHTVRLGPSTPNSGAPVEESLESATSRDEVHALPYFAGSHRLPATLAARGSRKGSKPIARKFPDYNPLQSILSQVRDAGEYPELAAVGAFYAHIRVYSDWDFGRTARSRKPASVALTSAELPERLDAHLAATLYSVIQTSTHTKIKQLLPELKATYQDFAARTAWGQVGLAIREASFKSDVPASRLSDGTLRFLALAAVLLRDDLPSLICLEEPELGMHPDMTRLVATLIADASERSQIVIATHSQDLLTALQDRFDCLFAFSGSSTGSTVLTLTRGEFNQWRKENALGDLWASGELGGVRY
ncbi:MAG: AAA family ATPase [Phycisphaerales bacterium]